MAVTDVRGVPTLAGKQAFANALAGLAAFSPVSFYRIGEGGFVAQPGGVQVPADPADTGKAHTTKTDIVAQGQGVNGLHREQKNFGVVDISTDTGVGGTTLTVNLTLDFAEGNDNGLGGTPQYFECGVFNAAGVMLAYGTFPREEKLSNRKLVKRMKITF